VARGIGGEDGPSLWMFICVILVWGAVKKWFSDASDKLDQNYANPFQQETTKQIQAKEKAVKNTTYKASNLRHKLDYYQQVADAQREEFTATFNIDEDKLISMLKDFNKDELLAVYKCFGVQDATILGIATATGNIFDFYNHLLTDSTLGGNDLSAMRAIWKKTGLWANF
jgi:hypothetical protein